VASAKIRPVALHHGGQGLIGAHGSLRLIVPHGWAAPSKLVTNRSTWAGRGFERNTSILTKAAGFPQLNEVSANAAHPADRRILVAAHPVRFLARIKCEPPDAFGELDLELRGAFGVKSLALAGFACCPRVQCRAFFLGKVLQDVLVGHARLGDHALPAHPGGNCERANQRAFNVVSRPKVGPIRVRQFPERLSVVAEFDRHQCRKPML
jgi:hypothetical protein